MYPKSKPPKAKPRFHGPFIIVKKWDIGTVIVRLQDGSEEIVNLDRCHTFKGQSMIEWTKDFVQSEKKDMGKSTALIPATRTQVTDEESQVSQIGSAGEEPQVVRMEEEESEISLFPGRVTQDTEMSEPPSNQKRISLYGSISAWTSKSFWKSLSYPNFSRVRNCSQSYSKHQQY